MKDNRKRIGTSAVFAASALVIFLSGCRSSPVGPSSGVTVGVNYSVLTRSHVNLTISNSYNTIVNTLVDSIQNAGNYRITWSTAAYPPGIYFYTLSEIPESGGAAMVLTKRFIVSG